MGSGCDLAMDAHRSFAAFFDDKIPSLWLTLRFTISPFYATANRSATWKTVSRDMPIFLLPIPDVPRCTPWLNAGRRKVAVLTGRFPAPYCGHERPRRSFARRLSVPLELDPNGRKSTTGLLAGLSEEEAAQSVPRPVVITPYTHTGRTGESRWEVYLRAGRNLQKLVDYPPGRILVVAHGGILNMALYAILGIPAQIAHSGATLHVPQHNLRNAILRARTSHLAFAGISTTVRIGRKIDLEKMNVLIFGAGAIGTYIGGSLAIAGNRVVFVEQPAQ